jgi:urease accessory protein
MLVSNGIVGFVGSVEDATGTLDFIDVPWAEAAKRLLRRRTKGGLDFALSMQHSQYLFHGAVLYNDEDHTVVVSRPEELALIVDLSQTSSVPDIVRQAALIGHAFGNQHVPVEVDGCCILMPMLSSEDLMTKTVSDLKLGELSLRFDRVRLGASRPLLMTGLTHE